MRSLAEHLGSVYDELFDTRHPSHREPWLVRLWIAWCRLWQ